MRIKEIIGRDPGQNQQLLRQYQYSPAGNITTKETEHGQYTYQYDKVYRLIEATNPGFDNESYTYDLLGNRLSSSSTTGTWSYNGNNELLGYDGISYQYDANGNTIQKNANGVITEYSYDIENRLIEVTTDNPQPATYKYYYDPFGRRLWKEVDGERTYFVYSDEGLVGEYDSSGQEIRTYGWAPDSGWSTDPLFVRIGGIYYWYRNDHLGTPQKVVSTSGAVVWSAIYDSFGKCQVQVETIVNNLRFPGQYYDSETGLYYNLNRYYDPTTGRYLNPDPLRDGINLYTYVKNNPLLLIDPYGYCAVKRAWRWWYDFWTSDPDFLIPNMWKNMVDYYGELISRIKNWEIVIIPEMEIDYDQIPRDFVPTTYRETVKAVGQTYDVLAHSEKLHKDIEFGARATWEVTKFTAKWVMQDIVIALIKIPGLRSIESRVIAGRAITLYFAERTFFSMEKDIIILNERINDIYKEVYNKKSEN